MLLFNCFTFKVAPHVILLPYCWLSKHQQAVWAQAENISVSFQRFFMSEYEWKATLMFFLAQRAKLSRRLSDFAALCAQQVRFWNIIFKALATHSRSVIGTWAEKSNACCWNGLNIDLTNHIGCAATEIHKADTKLITLPKINCLNIWLHLNRWHV